jgi:hypothetical protein
MSFKIFSYSYFAFISRFKHTNILVPLRFFTNSIDNVVVELLNSSCHFVFSDFMIFVFSAIFVRLKKFENRPG